MKVYLKESEVYPVYSVHVSVDGFSEHETVFEVGADTVKKWEEISHKFWDVQQEMESLNITARFEQERTKLEAKMAAYEVEQKKMRKEVGWADRAIEKLRTGHETTITPRGNSMKGLVEDGEEVVLVPTPDILKVGDIVLVRVKGKVYLHQIKAIEKQRYQIGNNRGGINGWVGRSSIYGIKNK